VQSLYVTDESFTALSVNLRFCPSEMEVEMNDVNNTTNRNWVVDFFICKIIK
jgi:hypothetical protein